MEIDPITQQNKKKKREEVVLVTHLLEDESEGIELEYVELWIRVKLEDEVDDDYWELEARNGRFEWN